MGTKLIGNQARLESEGIGGSRLGIKTSGVRHNSTRSGSELDSKSDFAEFNSLVCCQIYIGLSKR